MVNVIKFKKNYQKFCNQANARLVWIDEIRDCDFILNYSAIKAVSEYDVELSNNDSTVILRGEYFLLFFVGDKGIMFSTIRKRTPSAERKFINKIGQWFEVEVLSNDR